MKFTIGSGVFLALFFGRMISPETTLGETLPAKQTSGGLLSSVRVSSSPLFRLSFPNQTMRMGYSANAHFLFLTLLKNSKVLVVDSRTGKIVRTISDVPRPLDVAFDWKKRNILVTEADSRIFHLIPLDHPSGMKDMPTGLNPTVIEYRGALGTFLLAGAVHILYRLDPESDQVDRWTAFGDRIHEITFWDKSLYIPLLRHSRILVVDGKTLQIVHEERLDLCERLTTLLPLSDGGIAALCENELLVRRKAGDVFHHRYSDDSPRTMVGPVLGAYLLIFYPDAQEMVLTDLATLRPIQRIHLDGRPMWSKLNHDGSGVFIIVSSPAENKVRLERFLITPVYAPGLPTPANAPKGKNFTGAPVPAPKGVVFPGKNNGSIPLKSAQQVPSSGRKGENSEKSSTTPPPHGKTSDNINNHS